MEKVGDSLREKILIVDDARYQRALAADILARTGYGTVQVENTMQALQMVVAESPDLVILNALRPDLDGFDVCRRLKGDPFTNHIPILMLVTPDAASEKINPRRHGADSYLDQPFAPDQLTAHVSALLRRSFHYDPLTRLPAAPYLHRQIDARLAQNQPTAVLYVDLDHFRPLNQAYGHEAGDRALVLVAKLLVELLPPHNAFVGHLGSDDFMAVLPPQGAETFAQTLVDMSKDLQPAIYRAEDRRQGFLLVENRRGQPVKWPLMTLSAALVSNEQRPLINYVQVSDLLSEVMAYLKSQGGDKWARERRLR